MKNESVDLEFIKTQSIKGIVTYTVRTLFLQIFTFFATFFLTVLLDPSTFGVFFIVSAVINLFIYFSDIGLAAALIQKKENPTKADLSTSFFVQQSIIVSIVILGLLISPKIALFYDLNSNGLWLLRALFISLFLSSLKTIPSVLLERNLSFQKLVIPQIAETIIFYTIAISLALKGYGLSSFTWAVLVRGGVGLVIIYAIKPFIPSLSFSYESLKNLTKFGVPFQINSVLALLKDDLLTAFLGKILPSGEVGYIGWAQKFAFLPLRFVMDNVIKITFPAYSRIQHEKEILSAAVNKSVYFVTFSVYPLIFGLSAIATKALVVIPNYSKWENAVPALYFFSANAVFAAVNTTLTNVMFATGKPKIVLYLMFFWTTLTWVLTYTLAKQFGFIGVAAASAIVAASTSLIIYYVKKTISISIIKNIWAPLFNSTLMLLWILLFKSRVPNSYLGLIFLIATGASIYLALSILTSFNKIKEGLYLLRRKQIKSPEK